MSPKNAGNVVAEVLMTRASEPTCGIALLEGNRDHRFWKTRVGANTRLISCNGRPNLLSALVALDTIGAAGVVGIADCDYDRALGVAPVSTNLVVTDGCDLESLLLGSPALDRVLAEWGDEQAVRALLSRSGCGSIRDCLLRTAAFFGAVRLWLRRKNSGEPAARFVSLRFVDVAGGDWSIQTSNVIGELAIAHATTPEQVNAEVRAIVDAYARDDLVNGKDMVGLLSKGFGALLGGKPDIGPEAVSSLLRQAVENGFLRTTGLFQRLLEWQARTGAYTIID